ncbi:hypothetical protein Zmor_021969 [Zophobas morio]|uniref:Uncharacterized protein n=1 Tax=Zophobas morio TaxID=2755281 RepID=A0AA38MBP3_9CUCU|nr:hypothetical protein Zmor_021969 [Zophobas morio]
MDAMINVCEYAKGVNVGTWGTRQFCVMVTLDVSSPPTVSWEGTQERLVRMSVETYLVNMMWSCLGDILVQTEMGEYEITDKVPQVVLGPLFYGEVLRMEVRLVVQLAADGRGERRMRMSVNNMIELMLRNKEGWMAIQRMLVVIKNKNVRTRERKAEERM